MRTIHANFRKAWAGVTEQDIRVGAVAYHHYHLALRNFAKFYGTGFVQTVEAFVALSPNNDLNGNLRSLASCLFYEATGRTTPAPTLTTFRTFGELALEYLNGDRSFSDFSKGKKIGAFRHNILYPDTSHRVTVDGHMVCIAQGRDMTMKQANFALRETGYEPIEKGVQTLARRVCLAPCAVQAILWHWRKRVRGIKDDQQVDMFVGGVRWERAARVLDFPPYGNEAIVLWRPWASQRLEAFKDHPGIGELPADTWQAVLERRAQGLKRA